MGDPLHSKNPRRVIFDAQKPDEYGYYPGIPNASFSFTLSGVPCSGTTTRLGILNLYGTVEGIRFNLRVCPLSHKELMQHAREVKELLAGPLQSAVYVDVISDDIHMVHDPHRRMLPGLRDDKLFLLHRKHLRKHLRNRGLVELVTTAAESVIRWRDGLVIARIHRA